MPAGCLARALNDQNRTAHCEPAVTMATAAVLPRETPQPTGSRLLINAADSSLLGCPALQVADTPAVQAGGVQADPELFALDHLNDVLVTGVGLAGE